MSKVILDASALIALIQEEKGGEVIKPLLKDSVMSTINIAEVLTSLQRVGIFPDDAIVIMQSIVGTVIPFDVTHAQKAAMLYPLVKHRGLSLADRACISLGISMHLPIYTADKIWAELNLENADIRLIR